MIAPRFFRRWVRDCKGAAVIEFAMVAPVIISLMFGVIQVGIQMWCYNSMRSIVADAVRYTMVEYQKQDNITPDQIRTKAIAIAVNSPYNFDIDKLGTVQVDTPASDIAGMTKYTLSMTYTPPTVLDFTGIKAPTITFVRPLYVPA